MTKVKLRNIVTIFLIILFLSPIFSGCIASQEESDDGFAYEHEIIWLRVEDQYLATIDIKSTFMLMDLVSKEIVVEQKLDGLTIPPHIEQCNFSEPNAFTYRWEFDDHLTNSNVGPCLMMNGDFSTIESFSKLHLNICYVRNYALIDWNSGSHYNSHYFRSETGGGNMDVDNCDFLDYSLDISRSNYLELINSESSVMLHAVTYPTSSGTIRLFSNNSAVNLDNGKYFQIPIPMLSISDCRNKFSLNMDCTTVNWSSQEDVQNNPIIWEWFGPAGMPYPSDDGRIWFVNHCRGNDARRHTFTTAFNLIQEESGNYTWTIHEEYDRGGLGCYTSEPRQHGFSANIFWSRTMLSCNHHFHYELLREMYIGIGSHESGERVAYCSRSSYGEEEIDNITPYDYTSTNYRMIPIPSWEDFADTTLVYFVEGNIVHTGIFPSELKLKESGSDEFGIEILIFIFLIFCMFLIFGLGDSSPQTDADIFDKLSKRDPMKALLYAQIKAYENTGEMINPLSYEVTGANSSDKGNKSVGVIDYLDSATASWCPVCGGKMEGGPGGNRRHFCPSCGQMFDSNGNAVN